MDGPGARAGLPEELRLALPRHFEAVGEALVSGSGAEEACTAAGGELARDGASLEEGLAGLVTTYRLVRGCGPGHAATRAVALGWADATLGYLHGLSCEDPLTGLATQAHLRARLGDLYRGEVPQGVPVRGSHALVVLDGPRHGRERPDDAVDGLGASLRVGALGGTVRTVFHGSETIARVGPLRVVVLAGRDRLGNRLGLLRRLLADVAPAVRMWVEDLPGTDAAAARLLDELARG
ncbi:hypothetical protein ACT8ZV_04975 [Nocardioides sp. MAHUQ-72]|uniref:hypothetical protein n=1 Tax=unclassified Nocardioides TaxID=2615069 RepID=UPI00361C51FA